MSFVPLNNASATEANRDSQAAAHDQTNNQTDTKS